MPPTRKRRSEAISRDSSPESSPEPAQPQRSIQRRQRSPSTSSEEELGSNDGSEPDATATQSANTHKTLVKKLVRLALACEYSRLPLRRNEISQKVFKESGASGRSFKAVFGDAQKVLRGVFGMELVSLPEREKVGLKERRVAAGQATQASQKKAKGKGKEKLDGEDEKGTEGKGQGKSWILVSVLGEGYKNNEGIVVSSKAPTEEAEAGYTALYTFVVALVFLNANELSEGKMERYMDKVNVGAATEWGSWEKVLARMVREGYIDRRREEGEGWVYSVGPRGKIEVGTKGVEGLVKSVYGVFGGREDVEEGDGEAANATANGNVDEEELNKRLTRSLGVSVGGQRRDVERDEGEQEEGDGLQQPEPQAQPQPQQRRKSGRRRNARDDDDDDD